MSEPLGTGPDLEPEFRVVGIGLDSRGGLGEAEANVAKTKGTAKENQSANATETSKARAKKMTPPPPAPLATTVDWDRCTGARLEELVYGLLDAMGAQDLVWRAGSVAGITTGDGGRDLEAVFTSPTPDGAIEQTKWWIEAKGRTSTVKKTDVVASVTAVTAYPELDVLVFATNSRFSNPTRDWVTEWQKNRPHPKVRLWDRDELARIVRQYPLVAARAMPEALDDSDRLSLLVERFNKFGEPPTHKDLDYFWSHQAAINDQELMMRIQSVAMFTYSETDESLVERPWTSLLPTDALTDINLAIYSLVHLPRMLLGNRPRPLEGNRMVATAAYLLISILSRLEPTLVYRLVDNPHLFVDEMESISDNPEAVKGWSEYIVEPIWARVHGELKDVCADDCRRLMTDFGAALPPPLSGDRYWRRFGIGDVPDNRRLTIENFNGPCTVGLPLDEHKLCPLAQDIAITEDRVRDIISVVKYRTTNPGNHAYDGTSPAEVLAQFQARPRATRETTGE
jgi:hypothetical protein